jgi:hypothetical protein
MKFLCLAYGDEAGWDSLSTEEQEKALAQDEVIRRKGHLVSAVKPDVRTVRNWSGQPNAVDEPGGPRDLPLAGFSIIEANSIEEVVDLVSGTPCARARGYIEIRPFWDLQEQDDA